MKVLRATQAWCGNEAALSVVLSAEDADDLPRMLVVDGNDRIIGLFLPARDAEAFLFRRFIAKLNAEE